MKKIFQLLFSVKLMSLLFLVYALAMALATFIEEIYSSQEAKLFIYEALWFETVMVLLILCFVGNIGRYKLWRKEKWPILGFHLAFVIVFIGGALSRYNSFEGMMTIGEGNSSNEIISEKTYLKLQIKEGSEVLAYHVPYTFSPLHKNYKGKFSFKDQIVQIKAIDYVPSAKEKLTRSSNGERFIKLVSTNAQGRFDEFIQAGGLKNINGLLVGFEKEKENAICLIQKEGKLYIRSPFKGAYTSMASGKKGDLVKNTLSELHLRALYEINGQKIVIPDGVETGNLTYESDLKNQTLLDAFTVEISTKNQLKKITFLGQKGTVGAGKKFYLDGKEIDIGYGSIVLRTPFSIKLDKFELEKYPGSNTPSSFASEISVMDGDEKSKYRIFMNNVLDYRGFRFFQSGYSPDEKGTRLAVNQDRLGTNITYTGYLLLGLCMFFSLFWKGTHFQKLITSLRKKSVKKTLFLFLLAITPLNAQSTNSIKAFDLRAFVEKLKISKEHANQFGSLVIQDPQGRMKPLNTMALELVRKIHQKENIEGLTANQWMISIHQDPISWSQAPFIKVSKRAGNEFLTTIKANKGGYTSLMNLYGLNRQTGKIQFVLEHEYERAFSKSPSKRNDYDKEVIKLNEKVGIIAQIFQGSYLRIFPIPNDPQNTWTSWMVKNSNNSAALSLSKEYFESLAQSQQTQDWKLANGVVKKISTYQDQHGQEVVPSKRKINAELFYNLFAIFYYVTLAYALIGLLLFVLAFVKVFSTSGRVTLVGRALNGLFSLAFFCHSFGLVLRWYISGHAPWSNGYESAVFISWAIILAGIVFHREGNFFIRAASALASTCLLGVAHGSLMSPEITNLVPVLKSYWLIIHVAVITSSYGFFSIGAFLGLVVLILYALRNKARKKIFSSYIYQLSSINEISLTVGIFLLTIGTFLGGVWANESWGRYWSWDPKETWAFISVMIYAFVLHMRLVPALKSKFAFNLASVLALGSIIMTYFGVNYYLSGLHSYAKGDPVAIPVWIYYVLSGIFIIALIAYYKKRKTSRE